MTDGITRTPTENWIEFHPRPSHGRLWAGGMGVILTFLFGFALVIAWNEMPWFIRIPFAVLGIGTTAPLLVLAWYFPTMRYWLGRKELVLKYGPLMYDRVPLDAIQSIRRRNLRLSPVSTFRFPGLALLNVHYLGMGQVRMCATSASRGILLINIGHRRYGITPHDELGLVQAIRERSKADIRVSENFNPERLSETTISR
jgi:hypothetical protein